MNRTIHIAIKNALTEYEQLADMFERGECSKRDLKHAERKLNALRLERDMETWASRPQAVAA